MSHFNIPSMTYDLSQSDRIRSSTEARRIRRIKLTELRSTKTNLLKNVSDERKRIRQKRSSHHCHNRHEYCSSDIEDEEILSSYDPKKEAQKKERMLRNRESAALSRKRKREHTEKLEEKISALTAENNELREKLNRYECSFGINNQFSYVPQLANGEDHNMKRRPTTIHHPMNLVPIRDPKQVFHKNDMRNCIASNMLENDNSTPGCFNREFAAPATSTTKVESL